jgi:uncharacterized membrane protein
MSIASALSSPSSVSHRTLLFGSLALNLFFIGVTAALLIRSPNPAPRNVSARIERLAESLPAADALKLRTEFAAAGSAVEKARADYDKARDGIRDVLRREPFDAAAMREAMGKSRAARQEFDVVLQGMIAKAAGEMSPAGRQAMADWSPAPRGRGQH